MLDLVHAESGSPSTKRPTVLITGTTGWLGKLLAEALVADGSVRVLGLARRPTDIEGVESLQADLSTGAGLEDALSGRRIDTCVHLAGAAGWATLPQALEVNVNGTRRLLDALLPLGCRRFVIASSIAAIGTGTPSHPPPRFPIPDEEAYQGYPWPYALSKAQVEELLRFYDARERQAALREAAPSPPLDVLLLRIGCCLTDPPGPAQHLETAVGEAVEFKPVTLDAPPSSPPPHCFPEGPLAVVAVSDLVECLRLAVSRPAAAGLRVRNATAAHCFLAKGVTLPAAMRAWYGDQLGAADFAHYEQPGTEQASLFDCSAIRRELGWEPRVDVRTAYS